VWKQARVGRDRRSRARLVGDASTAQARAAPARAPRGGRRNRRTSRLARTTWSSSTTRLRTSHVASAKVWSGLTPARRRDGKWRSRNVEPIPVGNSRNGDLATDRDDPASFARSVTGRGQYGGVGSGGIISGRICRELPRIRAGRAARLRSRSSSPEMLGSFSILSSRDSARDFSGTRSGSSPRRWRRPRSLWDRSVGLESQPLKHASLPPRNAEEPGERR